MQVHNPDPPEVQTAEAAKSEADKISVNQQELIELWLSDKYEFRFNEIKGKPECREYGTGEYLPVDDRTVRSIKYKLGKVNIKTSVAALNDLIGSEFSTTCNPVLDYFNSLPPHDGQDHIGKLAATVLTNSANWYPFFTKWMVATVANAVTRHGCQNHTMLVLSGGQGKFKTTWLDNLCPPALRKNYLYTGKINTESKDSLSLLCEFFLINIDDQLTQINKRDENEIKNLITIPVISYRRPYAHYIEEFPRMGSFMGSVNQDEFLNDPSGSRRFLPFKVLSIDIDAAKALNIDRVWSHALHQFRSGVRYWFNDTEIQQLYAHNLNFEMRSIEEELISTYFKAPQYREQATHNLSNSDILSYLEKESRLRLNPKKLGQALTKLKFEKWQKTYDNGTRLNVYAVIKLSFDEVQASQTQTDKPF